MAVDKELFDQYHHSLGINAELLKLIVSRLVADTEGMTEQQRHLYLVANYPKWVRSFGIIAANAAADFYQRNRDAFFEGDDDADEYTAQTAQPISAEWALEDIRSAEADGVGTLPGIAVRRAMQRADQTMTYNVAHDPSHPRWAIVPNWGACGFCVLVASNGFFMNSRPVKVERHDHCRCQVVADHDTKNPSLEGYDPKAMRDAYSKCYDAVRDDLQRRWDALPEERKAKYLAKGGRGFDGFRRDEIVAEMNRRDRGWLQTGKAPQITVVKGATPSPSEMSIARTLADMGYKTEFRPTRGSEGKRTSDVYFVSGNPAKLERWDWEFKTPNGEGNGKWTINHQFKDAAGQSTRLVIDIAELEASTSASRWTREAIEQSALEQVDMPFRVVKGKMKGQVWLFDEVMLVSSDDSAYCKKYIRKGS